MKVIAYINQKGGVGKTTLLLNTAIYLANNNKKIFLIDTDQQCSTTNFMDNRSEIRKEAVSIDYIPCPLKGISSVLNRLSNKPYDYILIDTPGSASHEIIDISFILDYIVVPVSASWVDMDSTIPFIKTLINNNLEDKYRILLNNVSPIGIKEAKNTIQELGSNNLRLFNSFICNRKIYKESISNFMGITEQVNTASYIGNAKIEIKKYINELLLQIKGEV